MFFDITGVQYRGSLSTSRDGLVSNCSPDMSCMNLSEAGSFSKSRDTICYIKFNFTHPPSDMPEMEQPEPQRAHSHC